MKISMQCKNIKQIAAMARVSIGTVDRVLHNRGGVAAKTEERVRRIIRELDFKPNVFASVLKTGKTLCIGVLMPRTGPFCEYWELPLKGIRKAAGELTHFNVRVEYFFFDVAGKVSSFTKVSQELLRAKADGFIMAPVLVDVFRDLLTRIPKHLPYVFFDSFLPMASPLSIVAQDSLQAGRVAGHLMELLLPGGGEVVVVRNLPSDFHLNERENGFIDYLAGNSGIRTHIEAIDLTAAGGQVPDCVDGIFQRHPDMKGIFVTNANTFPYVSLTKKHPSGRRIVCIGFDLIGRNVEAMHNGSIDFLISQKPEEYGYLSVNALYRHLILKETVAKHIYTPIEIFCRENLL